MGDRSPNTKASRRVGQARWVGSLTPVLGASGVLTHGLSAAAGLALGIVCLRIARAYGGSMRDMDGAMMGVIVSALVLLMGLVHAPVFTSLREKARMGACRRSLESVARAIRVYAMNEGDRYPPAARWCDALVPSYLADPALLRCPDASGADCAYVFNGALGNALRGPASDPSLVVLFDGDGEWNANGGPELFAPRHAGGGWVAHADGRITWRRPGAMRRLPRGPQTRTAGRVRMTP